MHLARPVLRNPSNAELARAIGLRAPAAAPTACSTSWSSAPGPAGLAASVYGASEGLDTVTVDAVSAGGQAGTTIADRELPRLPRRDLRLRAGRARAWSRRDASARGSACPAEASGARAERGGDHVVALEDGSEVVARAVIVATGVRYRRLPVAAARASSRARASTTPRR